MPLALCPRMSRKQALRCCLVQTGATTTRTSNRTGHLIHGLTQVPRKDIYQLQVCRPLSSPKSVFSFFFASPTLTFPPSAPQCPTGQFLPMSSFSRLRGLEQCLPRENGPSRGEPKYCGRTLLLSLPHLSSPFLSAPQRPTVLLLP